MKSDITFIKLDGRNQQEEFHACITDTLKELQPGEGLHVIKDFEPFPLYELMAKKGFDKKVEQKAEDEFHVWFMPKTDLKMKQYLDLDHDKMQKIMDIKLKVFNKELTPQAAKELVNKIFKKITAEEFAYGEQQMIEYGISDEHMVDDMDDIIEVFKDVMETVELKLPAGHPIHTYQREADALEKVLQQMEQLLNGKFIKNQWLELYEKLSQINVHFSRKQNQLFSALEVKGFDRPSKVMWSFDNKVRETIKAAHAFLQADNDKAFLDAQANVFYVVRDILEKEREVLYPTSLQLLSDAEFAQMRISDDEIGYCLIDNPPAFKVKQSIDVKEEPKDENNSLLSDLTAVLAKHGVASSLGSNEEMDVSMGKLTLERINLIFKHLQVDLSYVDENDVVKFYSDTKHRVFPRSAGVIGRKVQNCHPRESVETVEQIIDAFRKGEQDEAEFWLEMGGKFIYIIYNAVRDDEGHFKGVLEMMQDVTHIRSLTGSQKLLTWKNEGQNEQNAADRVEKADGTVTPSSIIATVVKQYPFIKDFLVKLNPKYKQLKNPVVFKTMGTIATIDMIAKRGGYYTDELLNKINEEIARHKS